MNQLDRFRFGQLHKRRIVLFIVVLAVAVLLAGSFLGILGIFGQRSEFVRVKLSSDLSGAYNSGVGVNLSSVPSANRIPDPSFERGNTYRNFTVADTGSDFVFLENSEELPSIDRNATSRIRILSVGNDGIMTEKYSGRVTGFDEAGLGRIVYAEDPEGIGSGEPLYKLTSFNDRYVGLTSEGEIITGLFTSEPELILSQETFVDMCETDNTLYFLSAAGSVYISSDGASVSLFRELPLTDSEPVSLSVIGSNINIYCRGGEVLSVDSDSYRTVELPEVSEPSSPVCVTDREGGVIAVAEGHDIYVSRNGIFFSKVTSAVNYVVDRNIVSGTFSGGSFWFLCDDSSVLRLTESGNGFRCFRFDINGITISQICGTESGLLTAVSDDGRAFILEGDRYMEIEPSGMTVSRIYGGNSERLLVFGGGKLFYASVLSGIEVDEPVPSDSILEGDMCIFESTGNGDAGEFWHVSGARTGFSVTDSCSYDMSCSACISGQSEDLHAVWCDLGNISSEFSVNNFYRISLAVRGFNLENTDIYVWISGDSEGFGNEGFVISGAGDRFTEESYVFAVTDNMVRGGEDLKLNIAFQGTGMLYIDDIYLGEDKYGKDDMPQSFTDTMKDTSPAAIRFGSMVFASEGFSEETFYSSDVSSLENALKLTRDSGSDPWLVIGSYADRDSVEGMLTYLAGSVSSEKGRQRIDNGTAVPWSRQFDTIYIEITDSDGIFVTDAQRGAYVSYVIGLIRQSQYFSDIRERVVFLDGMSYEGGVILSNADFHSRSIVFDSRDYSGEYSQANYDSVRAAGHSSDSGEFISSLRFTPGSLPSTSAEVIDAILAEGSEFVRMTMVDVSLSPRHVDLESDMIFSGDSDLQDAQTTSQRMLLVLNTIRNLHILDDSQTLYREVLDPLNTSVAGRAEDFRRACTVRLVESEGNICLIVANHSDSQQQFLLVSGSSALVGSDIFRYGPDGRFLIKRNVLWIDRRQTIGPGEYLIINVQ